MPRLDAGSGYGFVRLNHIDSKMRTADIRNKWIDRDFVSVTNIKLQRLGCESGKDSRPSQDGAAQPC